jgi:hypothetical protein
MMIKFLELGGTGFIMFNIAEYDVFSRNGIFVLFLVNGTNGIYGAIQKKKSRREKRDSEHKNVCLASLWVIPTIFSVSVPTFIKNILFLSCYEATVFTTFKTDDEESKILSIHPIGYLFSRSMHYVSV